MTSGRAQAAVRGRILCIRAWNKHNGALRDLQGLPRQY
ncbi:hypothetical protein AEST_08080 [Alishewanella aestuarii B11]|uniref:Uncharacterized protein n=1 Tax=Alishewanella aestuarii B11 TaxID=1197174 RepID=J2IH05_9ALTE|nr:hypothetical protein AEST_08080 [Alishewanella aestuarii B11]